MSTTASSASPPTSMPAAPSTAQSVQPPPKPTRSIPPTLLEESALNNGVPANKTDGSGLKNRASGTPGSQASGSGPRGAQSTSYAPPAGNPRQRSTARPQTSQPSSSQRQQGQPPRTFIGQSDQPSTTGSSTRPSGAGPPSRRKAHALSGDPRDDTASKTSSNATNTYPPRPSTNIAPSSAESDAYDSTPDSRTPPPARRRRPQNSARAGGQASTNANAPPATAAPAPGRVDPWKDYYVPATNFLKDRINPWGTLAGIGYLGYNLHKIANPPASTTPASNPQTVTVTHTQYVPTTIYQPTTVTANSNHASPSQHETGGTAKPTTVYFPDKNGNYPTPQPTSDTLIPRVPNPGSQPANPTPAPTGKINELD